MQPDVKIEVKPATGNNQIAVSASYDGKQLIPTPQEKKAKEVLLISTDLYSVIKKNAGELHNKIKIYQPKNNITENTMLAILLGIQEKGIYHQLRPEKELTSFTNLLAEHCSEGEINLPNYVTTVIQAFDGHVKTVDARMKEIDEKIKLTVNILNPLVGSTLVKVTLPSGSSTTSITPEYYAHIKLLAKESTMRHFLDSYDQELATRSITATCLKLMEKGMLGQALDGQQSHILNLIIDILNPLAISDPTAFITDVSNVFADIATNNQHTSIDGSISIATAPTKPPRAEYIQVTIGKVTDPTSKASESSEVMLLTDWATITSTAALLCRQFSHEITDLETTRLSITGLLFNLYKHKHLDRALKEGHQDTLELSIANHIELANNNPAQFIVDTTRDFIHRSMPSPINIEETALRNGTFTEKVTLPDNKGFEVTASAEQLRFINFELLPYVMDGHKFPDAKVEVAGRSIRGACLKLIEKGLYDELLQTQTGLDFLTDRLKAYIGWAAENPAGFIEDIAREAEHHLHALQKSDFTQPLAPTLANNKPLPVEVYEAKAGEDMQVTIVKRQLPPIAQTITIPKDTYDLIVKNVTDEMEKLFPRNDTSNRLSPDDSLIFKQTLLALHIELYKKYEGKIYENQFKEALYAVCEAYSADCIQDPKQFIAAVHEEMQDYVAGERILHSLVTGPFNYGGRGLRGSGDRDDRGILPG